MGLEPIAETYKDRLRSPSMLPLSFFLDLEVYDRLIR